MYMMYTGYTNEMLIFELILTLQTPLLKGTIWVYFEVD